jgi:hypothetical protein
MIILVDKVCRTYLKSRHCDRREAIFINLDCFVPRKDVLLSDFTTVETTFEVSFSITAEV